MHGAAYYLVKFKLRNRLERILLRAQNPCLLTFDKFGLCSVADDVPMLAILKHLNNSLPVDAEPKRVCRDENFPWISVTLVKHNVFGECAPFTQDFSCAR